MRNGIIAIIIVLTAAAASGQVIATRSSAYQLLIPAAGAIDGNNGTFFRSDITLINYRSASQIVRFQWLPQSVSGVGLAPVDMTIGASAGFNSEDFVTNVLHRSGLGAILVTGITAAGDVDTGAQLVATSRIWTPQPGSGGTTSQSLPSVATTDINSASLDILSARRDSRYRSNAGIVNLSTTVQRFQVFAAGSSATDSQQVDVQPLSMVQVAVSGASSAVPLQINVSNISTIRSNAWIAYASSIDNITGDAWTTLGFTRPSTTP